MPKVLIIDDDINIVKLVKTYCEVENYECDYGEDGEQAVRLIKNNKYDIIILDVMMAYKDGFEVLREVRTFCNTPVIMLTAKTEEYDKLNAFDLGADDFVAKPFSPKELMARIKVILKRNKKEETEEDENGTITIGEISVNLLSREATVKGEDVVLTPKEFDLLVFLMKNEKHVMTREQLLDKVWGYDYFGDARTVDTHIKSLRERLGDCRSYIKTVWSVGYMFEYKE